MIGVLVGTVRHGCVLTSSGIGYRVDTSASLIEDAHVELIVETVQGTSDTRLFGFVTNDERQAFVSLCKIPGVGPAAAMSLLRTLGLSGLCLAVTGRDESAVRAARGVGARAATAVIAGFDPTAFAHVASVAPEPLPGDDLVTTLCSLGFSERAVRDALVGLEGDEADVLASAIERLSADRVTVQR